MTVRKIRFFVYPRSKREFTEEAWRSPLEQWPNWAEKQIEKELSPFVIPTLPNKFELREIVAGKQYVWEAVHKRQKTLVKPPVHRCGSEDSLDLVLEDFVDVSDFSDSSLLDNTSPVAEPTRRTSQKENYMRACSPTKKRQPPSHFNYNTILQSPSKTLKERRPSQPLATASPAQYNSNGSKENSCAVNSRAPVHGSKKEKSGGFTVHFKKLVGRKSRAKSETHTGDSKCDCKCCGKFYNQWQKDRERIDALERYVQQMHLSLVNGSDGMETAFTALQVAA